MHVSESQKRASKKYAKNNLKRIPLDVKIEEKEAIVAYSTKMGYSVRGFILEAIHEKMERDIENISPKVNESK